MRKQSPTENSQTPDQLIRLRPFTGPRTQQGKGVSSRNAVTHGILSKAVVLRSKNSGETQEDFDQLLASFSHELLPVGPLEETLVEKMVICIWRQRRLLRSETGQIDRNLAAAECHEQQQLSEQMADRYRLDTNSASRLCWSTRIQGEPARNDQDFEIRQRRRNSSIGLRELRHELSDFRFLFRTLQDFLVEHQEWLFLQHFGREEKFVTRVVGLNREISNLLQPVPGPPEPYAPANDEVRSLKAEIIAIFDQQLEVWEKHENVLAELEKEQLEAKKRALALPQKEVADLLIRYETSLDRAYYRATQELERLQRRRKGEFVAPPASINVA